MEQFTLLYRRLLTSLMIAHEVGLYHIRYYIGPERIVSEDSSRRVFSTSDSEYFLVLPFPIFRVSLKARISFKPAIFLWFPKFIKAAILQKIAKFLTAFSDLKGNLLKNGITLKITLDGVVISNE